MIAGLGRRPLQIHEERHDGVGQQPPQVVEQRGLARAALAVEQQGRAAPVQQELFDPGADVGAPHEDLRCRVSGTPITYGESISWRSSTASANSRTWRATTSRHCVAMG